MMTWVEIAGENYIATENPCIEDKYWHLCTGDKLHFLKDAYLFNCGDYQQVKAAMASCDIVQEMKQDTSKIAHNMWVVCYWDGDKEPLYVTANRPEQVQSMSLSVLGEERNCFAVSRAIENQVPDQTLAYFIFPFCTRDEYIKSRRSTTSK